MGLLRTAIGMAALTALVALPPSAVAETVVPPGNSAATQYTETFPTSNGEADLNQGIDGGEREPSKVLGAKTAHHLDNAGPEGEAVATFAAATAPPTAAAPGGGARRTSSHRGQGSAHPGAGSDAAEPAGRGVSLPRSSGSSALGQVVGQATGVDSGRLGIWLPLLLGATAAWAIVYAWRRRQVAP
jgi:hypothetical protein